MPPKAGPLPQPDFEDESTLFSLSSEFLEAATALHNTSPTRVKYTLVTFYLVGHAAELLLKSFLFKHGDTIEDLRKRYGHDLKLLVKRARLKGLVSSISTEHILKFASIYTRKRTEYRQTRELRFPPLDLLLREVQFLQAHVFNHVAEF